MECQQGFERCRSGHLDHQEITVVSNLGALRTWHWEAVRKLPYNQICKKKIPTWFQKYFVLGALNNWMGVDYPHSFFVHVFQSEMDRVFHYKASIFRYPYFWKHPNQQNESSALRFLLQGPLQRCGNFG